MHRQLFSSFTDELEKIGRMAGVGKAMSGSAPKAITSAKALATAPMKVPKPTASKGGGVMKFRKISIKGMKNPGQSVSVSPNRGAMSVSTPSVEPRAPLSSFI